MCILFNLGILLLGICPVNTVTYTHTQKQTNKQNTAKAKLGNHQSLHPMGTG